MPSPLKTQLKNAKEIKEILKEVSVNFTLSDEREVRTLLTYLPIKAGVSDHSDLFKVIREGILTNFVFSCSEIEKKLGVKNGTSAEDLFDKAIRKLSKQTAHGELGELILFTLLDVYFEAPKILSKVSLKTSPKMPVFGADAVHGKFHDKKFMLYLGEAKLYKDFAGAPSAAAQSILNTKEKYEVEFDLLDSYIDLPGADKNLEKELLSILNPFSSHDRAEILHSPCFIGFTDPDLISECSTEEEFLENYIDQAGEHIETFFGAIESQGLTVNEVSLLMLPFSCTDKLVEEFVAYMGIKK